MAMMLKPPPTFFIKSIYYLIFVTSGGPQVTRVSVHSLKQAADLSEQRVEEGGGAGRGCSPQCEGRAERPKHIPGEMHHGTSSASRPHAFLNKMGGASPGGKRLKGGPGRGRSPVVTPPSWILLPPPPPPGVPPLHGAITERTMGRNSPGGGGRQTCSH